MPVQFPYPEQGWSTGTMRKVRDQPLPDSGTTSEQAAGKGSMDYDVLHEQIGPEGTAFIKRFDEVARNPDADPQLIKNWKQWREYWIDMYRKGTDVPEPGAVGKPPPGMAKMQAPTMGQAGQVLEQAAGRTRGKRKEAEAM